MKNHAIKVWSAFVVLVMVAKFVALVLFGTFMLRFGLDLHRALPAFPPGTIDPVMISVGVLSIVLAFIAFVLEWKRWVTFGDSTSNS